jgi:putative tricarboxylic transport membrane protein
MWRRVILMTVAACMCAVSAVYSFELQNPECIAPAKPGGGHDNMCRLLAVSYSEALLGRMSIRYMPGGIGALAYNHAVNVSRKDANLIVAASTGTALNLAMGKFGDYTASDVRWLGAVATDYGVVAVRGDAPWHSLDDLMDDLKKKKRNIVMGAAGSIGSQDWMKMALIFDQAGLDPRQIRYIPYEGGGEASNALMRGYIQVFPGDISEVAGRLGSGKIRVLAVLSDKRLPGRLSGIPTAMEQGYKVVWPVWRGYYLPPDISNDEYQWWINTLYRLESTKAFTREREKLELFPLVMIGDMFEQYVRQNVRDLKAMARKFGLVR